MKTDRELEAARERRQERLRWFASTGLIMGAGLVASLLAWRFLQSLGVFT